MHTKYEPDQSLHKKDMNQKKVHTKNADNDDIDL